MRQETQRFLRETVPPGAASDTERYGLQENSTTPAVDQRSYGPLKTIVVSGSFTATIQMQGTLDGANWIDVGSSVTVPAIIDIEQAWAQLRVVVTGHSAGAAFVHMGAYNVDQGN